MAIFDRLAFLEGDQADAYKARKEAERDEKLRQDRERFERRYVKSTPGVKHSIEYDEANEGKEKNPLMALTRQQLSNAKYLKEKNGYSTALYKTADSEEKDLEKTKAREYGIGKETGVSKAEIDKLHKINDWDYEASPDEEAWASHMDKTQRGRDFAMKVGTHQAADSLYKHMRRHPEKYKESAIFESIRFLNE